MKKKLMAEVDYEPLVDHGEFGLRVEEAVPDIGPGNVVAKERGDGENDGAADSSCIMLESATSAAGAG